MTSTANTNHDTRTSPPAVVVLFYKYFVSAAAHPQQLIMPQALVHHQKDLCTRLACKGRVLIAQEGINGTLVAANATVMDQYIAAMKAFDVQDYMTQRMANASDDSAVVDTTTAKDQSPETASTQHDERARFIYRDIDWKISSVESSDTVVFPDLKVSLVKEIVSSSGLVSVQDLQDQRGIPLSPQDFHDMLKNGDNKKDNNLVLVDVRNTFEYAIGHFVAPSNQQAALNPEMVTFSSFDTNFCQPQAQALKDKTILMYCTGGIRCEKASVLLKQKGVDNVYHLQGGIHRYLEAFPNDGYFQGKNFVFDQRVTQNATSKEIVGQCGTCQTPYDELSGSRICTVCRDLVLVCPTCQSNLMEYHCPKHHPWKHAYFTFLERFDAQELQQQLQDLNQLLGDLQPPSQHKRVRRTLRKQCTKVQERLEDVKAGRAMANPQARRRCRTCLEADNICDGLCWGFWKRPRPKKQESPPKASIAVGDRVIPGPHWNELRLGSKTMSDESQRVGVVTGIKSWAGDDENDCVCVLWESADKEKLGRNQAALHPKIYRYGVAAVDGSLLYDVEKVE